MKITSRVGRITLGVILINSVIVKLVSEDVLIVSVFVKLFTEKNKIFTDFI